MTSLSERVRVTLEATIDKVLEELKIDDRIDVVKRGELVVKIAGLLAKLGSTGIKEYKITVCDELLKREYRREFKMDDKGLYVQVTKREDVWSKDKKLRRDKTKSLVDPVGAVGRRLVGKRPGRPVKDIKETVQRNLEEEERKSVLTPEQRHRLWGS